MTRKEAIIKGWIEGSGIKKIRYNIHYEDYNVDCSKDNPYFISVLTGKSFEKGMEITNKDGFKFIIKAKYEFNIKTGELYELEETKRFPFVYYDDNKEYIERITKILFDGKYDNFKGWDYRKKDYTTYILDASIIDSCNSIDNDLIIGYKDVLIAKLIVPCTNNSKHDFLKFEDCKVIFEICRIGDSVFSFYDFSDPKIPHSLFMFDDTDDCSKVYDNILIVKKELKEKLKETLVFETKPSLKFVDNSAISLRQLYKTIKYIYEF